jgi:hypothetical protein
MYILPLRRTTLQSAERFFTDVRTFMAMLFFE